MNSWKRHQDLNLVPRVEKYLAKLMEESKSWFTGEWIRDTQLASTQAWQNLTQADVLRIYNQGGIDMNNLWYMTNVIWYDGCSAYVSKFIVRADWVEDVSSLLKYPELTNESKQRVREYLDGNEVLKFDPLYPVDLDDILALKDSESDELAVAYNRFKEMWF